MTCRGNSTSLPGGCICCSRFHTDVFFSCVEELRLSWSSIFSSTLTSLTNCSIAAQTGGTGQRSEGAVVQHISREGRGLAEESKQTRRYVSQRVSLFSFPRVFLSFSVTLLLSLSTTTRHLITQSPCLPSSACYQPD